MLFVKGSELTVPTALIDVLQPTIEKVCAEAQVGHWSVADGGEARLSGEFDAFLAGTSFPDNFAIVADSQSKEFKAVREVLNRHASMVLRGV